MRRPDICYLILNYNPRGEGEAYTVLEQTVSAFYERKSTRLVDDVYLMDQGSPSGHREKLASLQNRYGFSLILLNRNVGISKAINFLARTAKGDVIALVTSDVVVTTGMDEDLYRKVQIPEVFQATPFTDKSDVEHQVWKPDVPYGSDRLDLTDLRRREDGLIGRLLGKPRRGYLRYIGAEFNVMFWRREIFDKVGYFDERWKAAYENIDYSLRCFLAGGCTALSLESFVWHFHKVTEKNGSRELAYDHLDTDWRRELRDLWDQKWPGLENYISVYKPLGDKTIHDYPAFYERFQHNIYLPYGQETAYY